MNETARVTSENLDIISIAEEQYVSVPVELDGREIMKCLGTGTFYQGDALFSNEANICHELSEFLSLDAQVQKLLSTCKMLPFSRGMQTYPSNRRPDSPNATAKSRDTSARETSAYTRSISLPSSSTLVSALKGGRALSGTSATLELCVKWAPEVYDPPTTLMSHTVNPHQQRPKAKKRDKHKNKGKSSQGNGGERKQGNHKRSKKTPEPRDVRLQTDGECLVLDAFGVNGEEMMKCGGSFLKEALPEVHLSVGEAS